MNRDIKRKIVYINSLSSRCSYGIGRREPMKKWINRKKVAIIVGIIVLLSGGLFTYYAIEERGRRDREVIALEGERIANAYLRVNVAFNMVSISGRDRELLIEQGIVIGLMRDIWMVYLNFPELGWWDFADSSLNPAFYLSLRFYENRTGVYLSYEKAMDYFSQEFEPDGSLRLYNNGNHPEIEAFVDWFWENKAEFDEFQNRMRQLLFDYFNANESAREMGTIFRLSPQMLDALARAEADPGYVLDLTSLREQGY